ncbi:MAG: hypothetical protein A2V99_08450 [Spirochaetes bacterium RBG_16_67_19]|nr:MAG: hypothetical protein A2V99_08450 [Spirochaetes bacterium RBG_16_67_19]
MFVHMTIPGLIRLLAGFVLAGAFLASPAYSQDRQGMIHSMGAQVMPFSLAKTLHVFEMTESGGIQQVVIRDQADSDQIPMIRMHLQHEAMLFSSGNYSDPASLHGTQMPGVKELTEGAAEIHIEFEPLPNGAQIVFSTSDLHLLTALHRWFGAQLSDHGADAAYR